MNHKGVVEIVPSEPILVPIDYLLISHYLEVDLLGQDGFYNHQNVAVRVLDFKTDNIKL